ncbi:HD domain-containing protein [Rudanella paleaurantiibacter]|uniref:HD domain-containing protein n=1 Tax=Rudanella paleaurantiibacter TaxID=2614655 RepID=A0A7J5TWJ0_9BACT|nr:HD domain-containing protein [Rudanella paleaurantiibacter]KAB7727632.1 HD domain-containing protein [Rudanella paleaurantiibacter]
MTSTQTALFFDTPAGNLEAVWLRARPHLNVRNNDEHTLFSFLYAKTLCETYPDADAGLVLPAILLHDTGWSKIPPDKILHAFGPNNKYPELTRQHELESLDIAMPVLTQLGYADEAVEQILNLIDGHDTTKHARSLNDAIHKDADKLWRYTPHGNRIIGEWFEIGPAQVLDILENFVLPGFLTDEGRRLATLLLQTARLNLEMSEWGRVVAPGRQ